nr:growth arrest and DNA damage-inducible protein GADD45 beta-like [Pelodiscus sinensis]|eukprot:XP_014433901.1 growth arrest and DNA damage-inducible protein GADD45 beta-like [Pelodiscus sinensis]
MENSVVLCLLATDEEDADDIALQIHFTLIQAFCCDNDIHILRVSGQQRAPRPALHLGDGDCLLATDEEDADDIALQIHFTLIQAFCCDNDIHILRVSGMQRLATVLGENPQDNSEPRDLHCILVTNPHTDSWKSQGLEEVASYCEESRCNNQWVPCLSLLER